MSKTGIILLDENFYLGAASKEHLDMVLNFLNTYITVDVAIMKDTSGIQSGLMRNMKAIISSQVQKQGRFMLFDVPSVGVVEEQGCFGFSEDFSKQVRFLDGKFDYVLIIASPEKYAENRKTLTNSILILNHPYEELGSQFAWLVQNGLFVQNVKKPAVKNPLPNVELCRRYLGVQVAALNLGEDKYELFSKVAREVAGRNTYTYNKLLSVKNGRAAKREIYSSRNSHLSVDFEKGCFEVYSQRGEHRGEWSYTNKMLSEKDASGRHDIEV